MSYKINDTVVVDDSRNVCACCVTSCCITASDQMVIPSGDTASRPTGATGSLYFDTDEGALVAYDGTEWAKQGGAGVTQVELVQMGNFVGPFVCKASHASGPTNGTFNPCTLTVYTYECCGSTTVGRSLRWCDSGCCFCYLYPAVSTAPTPTNPECSFFSIAATSVAYPGVIMCCLIPMKNGLGMFYSNTAIVECNGCRLGDKSATTYNCNICGHTCCWYQGGFKDINGNFVLNMSNPDFIAFFPAKPFRVCTHPGLCDGCCCCYGTFMSCICACGCGECVGTSTPHKVLYEKISASCCVVFKPCCASKVMCNHRFLSLANGFLVSAHEEGCTNCHVWNHYFFVCANTGETTRLWDMCHCHGYLWDHCNNQDVLRTGMNATLFNARCCRCSAYAGCFRGSFVTVSLKGTDECPCFDPDDYIIKCCCFSGKNIPDIIKCEICLRNGLSENGHATDAFGRLHMNRYPFQTNGSLGDYSCGWLGRSGLEFTTESGTNLRVYKKAAGSYRRADVVNDEVTPTYFTSYVPCDVETWGCLHCCNSHPSTPCPQNLLFICWLPGSGVSMGWENKWHAAVFCSCNCTCSCCKCLTYVALFCG